MLPPLRLRTRSTSLVSLLLVLLAGCGDAPAAPAAAGMVGAVHGWVLDAAYRPVPDAIVRIEGIGTALTDDEGHYRLEHAWPAGQFLVIAEAPGFVSQATHIDAGTQAQHFLRNFTLAPLPQSGWIDTQAFSGIIACGIIVQVGHDHGSGGEPNDDNHVSCPVVAVNGKQLIEYHPEPDPEDMLIEVVWKANTQFAEFITVVLRDDEGELVQFDEGNSPLRLDVPRVLVAERFANGRSGTIELLPGIPETGVADVYASAHVDQRFDVFATTSHGMPLGIHHSVIG